MRDKYSRKYHIEKNYYDEPREFEKAFLIQVGRTHCAENYAVNEHIHRNWFELTHIIDGSGEIFANSIGLKVKAGDIHLSFPGEVHAIRSDNEHPLKMLFLSLWPKDDAILEKFEKTMLYYSNSRDRIFSDKDVQRLMEQTLYESLVPDEFSYEMISSSLNQILLYILRNFEGEKKDRLKVNSAEELCYQLMNYVNTHIYVINNLESLSEYFGYSYSYLSDMFRKSTGDTLINYYTSRRLDAATHLIKEDLAIGEIAELLRYSSIYTFSRAFKNTYGISPTNYKKQMNI